MTFPFKKVLVAVDDGAISTQAERVLRHCGAREVIWCVSGRKAMERVELDPNFQLLVVDLRISDPTGATFLQYVRSHQHAQVREASVLILRGAVRRDDLVLMAEIGYLDHVSKTFTDQMFAEKLQELARDRSDPHSERSFSRRYLSQLQAGDFAAAEETLTPRLTKEPASPKLLAYYADLLFRARELDRAEAVARKVLSASPHFLPAMNSLAKILVAKGKHREAVALVEKARELSPQNIERALVLGELHLGADLPEKAEQDFRSVLDLDPVDWRAQYGLGRTLVSQGRIKESRRTLPAQRFTEIASFFNSRAVLLSRSQRYTEAVTAYRNALSIMEDSTRMHQLWFNIALAHYKAQDYERAFEAIEQCARSAPPTFNKLGELMGLIRDKRQDRGPGAVHFSMKAAGANAVRTLPALAQAKQGSEKQKQKAPASAATAPQPQNDEFLLTEDQLDFILGSFKTQGYEL